MAQENPEKFPTGDTAARDEEADQKPAAVSPEDRSLLTRGFARAIVMGDTFAPNFPFSINLLYKLLQSRLPRNIITTSRTKYTP